MVQLVSIQKQHQIIHQGSQQFCWHPLPETYASLPLPPHKPDSTPYSDVVALSAVILFHFVLIPIVIQSSISHFATGGITGSGTNGMRTALYGWQKTGGDENTRPEAFFCDMSDDRTDICRMIGDVRIDVVSRKIVLYATQVRSLPSFCILTVERESRRNRTRGKEGSEYRNIYEDSQRPPVRGPHFELTGGHDSYSSIVPLLCKFASELLLSSSGPFSLRRI
jgi:hypothetical protein